MNVAELAFLILIVAKTSGEMEDLDWWMVFVPLILFLVYDVIVIIAKMHNKSKK